MIQLLLLRHLLDNLNPNAANIDALRPGDYFDVIAGTSAGGLNALLLGRLGFSIQAFSKITETVFEESGGAKTAIKEGRMFELARLDQAMDALLGDRANELMHEPTVELTCNVCASHQAFVCADPCSVLRDRRTFDTSLHPRSYWSARTASHLLPWSYLSATSGPSRKQPVPLRQHPYTSTLLRSRPEAKSTSLRMLACTGQTTQL
jgi:hypothetical protein